MMSSNMLLLMLSDVSITITTSNCIEHALTGSLQLKYGTAILKKRIMLSLLQREVIPLHTDLTVEEDEAISKQRIL